MAKLSCRIQREELVSHIKSSSASSICFSRDVSLHVDIISPNDNPTPTERLSHHNKGDERINFLVADCMITIFYPQQSSFLLFVKSNPVNKDGVLDSNSDSLTKLGDPEILPSPKFSSSFSLQASSSALEAAILYHKQLYVTPFGVLRKSII